MKMELRSLKSADDIINFLEGNELLTGKHGSETLKKYLSELKKFRKIQGKKPTIISKNKKKTQEKKHARINRRGILRDNQE